MFTQIRKPIVRGWTYAGRIHQRYSSHFGGLMSGGIAFYALLSLVPLLSVAVAILGWVVGSSSEALLEIKSSIRRYMPASDELIYSTLQQIKESRGVLGAIGLVGLLVTGSAIFTNLEAAFNYLWDLKERRTWLMQRLVALFTAVLALVLLFLTVGLTAVLTYLRHDWLPSIQNQIGHIPFIGEAAGYGLSIALSISMFAAIYRVVPARKPPWRDVAVGATVAGIAWEVAKILFAVYVAHLGNYARVYGSLGSIVVLMLWAYYSCTILFIGAEIAADCGARRDAGQPCLEAPPKPARRRAASG